MKELSKLLELTGMKLVEEIELDEKFDIIEDMVEELAESQGVDAEVIWEDFEAVDDITLYETAAWKRKEGKSKSGGLNKKGVASYRREHPGSKLQTAVTTKPSKLKKGSKAAKRRKSFCARMGGMKGPMKKPNGKPTRKALALRKWNCHESVEEQELDEAKQRLDPKCWTGYHKAGTKMKGGVRVNNCVPNESVEEAGSPAQQAAIAIAKKKKQGVAEGKFEYDKKTGQMGHNKEDSDQRHGLYMNGKLIRTYNSRTEAENVKTRDSRYKDATIKKVAEAIDLATLRTAAGVSDDEISRRMKAAGPKGPPKATMAFGKKQDRAAALHHFKVGMANDNLKRFKEEIDPSGQSFEYVITRVKNGKKLTKHASKADMSNYLDFLKSKYPNDEFEVSQRPVVGEGSMGGINRSAPAVDVSYEKVLDEVMEKWQRELSQPLE